MRVSTKALQLLKEFEGFRAAPYLCPSGVVTIGYGHTAGVTMQSEPITEQLAAAVLALDVRRYEEAVEAAVTVPLSQSEFDALVCWTFNVGVSAMRTSTLLRAINAGDRAAAAVEFLKWDKGRQGNKLVTLPGLTRRRQTEKALFEGRAA